MTAVEVPTDLPTESDESKQEAPSPAVNGHETPDDQPVRDRKESENAADVRSENGKSSTTDETPPDFNDERRDSRIADARNKFETQQASKKAGIKRKEKVKYAGLESAKTKFIDAATADRRLSQEKKKPIRITPPRDPNYTGVVESEPAERDPNVIRSDSMTEDEVLNTLSAKNARAKFKEFERAEPSSGASESKVELESGLTKNMLTEWKKRETNPEPGSQERKAPVKIREEGDGGVYENNPEVLTDVVRATDQPDEVMPEGVDTRALRDRFLRASLDEDKAKKLSALEEISQMARLEQNVVYENIPSAPREGVVRSQIDDSEGPVTSVSTKELRSKFVEQTKEKQEKEPINIASGEGGVYENQPVALEGVVRAGEYRGVNIEDEVGRWASEARLRFMEDACRVTETVRKEKPPVKLDLAEGGVFENEPSQRREDIVYSDDTGEIELPENTVKNRMQRLIEIKEEASRIHTSKTPVIVEKNDTSAGVYENVPESSQADACAADMLALQPDGADEASYTAQAKQRFLEKQKEEEEARKRKEAPQMVDIWADLCRDSGVFENKPVERDPKVLREFTPSEDEMEEEEEEEEEAVNGAEA